MIALPVSGSGSPTVLMAFAAALMSSLEFSLYRVVAFHVFLVYVGGVLYSFLLLFIFFVYVVQISGCSMR